MNHPFRRSLHPTLSVLLGVLLGLSGAGGRAEPSEKPGGAAPPTDRWAGKSVLTAEHVQEMVAGRLRNAPRQGELAPPFALREARTKKTVFSSDLHRWKPLVLFFGSGSCSVTRRSCEDVVKLWRKYRMGVDFYLVYIREAHPRGGTAFGGEVRLAAEDPLTDEAREAAALEFAREKGIEFPVLVDRMDDATAVRWGAWPVRLFMIDTTGAVVFAGQQGPWFHRPTADYDPRITNVPTAIKDLPGYSRGSLEEALARRFPAVK